MEAITAQRTPDLIADEINSIKSQTREMVLYSSIEIGRRLVEAKSMLKHGQWISWLKNSVNYSVKTANYLMKMHKEYGSEDKITTFGSLNSTQAIILFGVPKEEREKFILTPFKINGALKTFKDMSIREAHSIVKGEVVSKKSTKKCDICAWGGAGLESLLIPYHMRKYTIVKGSSVVDVEMAMVCPNCFTTIDLLKTCKDKNRLEVIKNSIGKKQINKIREFLAELTNELQEVI